MYRYFVSYWDHFRNRPGSRYLHLEEPMAETGTEDQAHESLDRMAEEISGLLGLTVGGVPEVTILFYRLVK